MNDHPPPLPDEDTLVIPKGWRRRIHPRRGGSPGPKITIDADAEKTVHLRLEQGRVQVETALLHDGTDPELVKHARAYLADEPDPLGAAVVAEAASWGTPRETAVEFVDAWTQVHGLPFAACAVLEWYGLERGTNASHRPDHVKFAPVSARWSHSFDVPDGAARVRALLAAAAQEDYDAAVERLAGLRRIPRQRLLAAFLVPTRQDWVAECCANPPEERARIPLLTSLGAAEQVEILGSWMRVTLPDAFHPEVLNSLAEGVGVACTPLMADALGRMMDSAPRRKALLEVLSVLPSDEAFAALVARRDDRPQVNAALAKAMDRFPVRAMRELAAAGATELLDEHVQHHRELATAALPVLPGEARAQVERILGTTARVRVAGPDELPSLLVEPPWARAEKKPKPLVIDGLTVPDLREVRWADGERERWWWWERRLPQPREWAGGVEHHDYRWDAVPQRAPMKVWEERVAALAAKQFTSGRSQLGVLTMAPDTLVRPLLADFELDDRNGSAPRDPEEWLKVVLARFELDALHIALTYARKRPGPVGELLVPFLDAEVATVMADWLSRVKTARKHATAWFARHGGDAARLLVPSALGKRGKQRTAAEFALHHLAREIGRDAVVEAARTHGEAAAQAVGQLLQKDQASLTPPKLPKLPAWADPATLPQVLRHGRESALPDTAVALPDTAVAHVLTILALSTPEKPDPGIEIVREACDAASLAAFVSALFERWHGHGEAAADAWALTALGWFGDDEAARRLAPLIHTWPGHGGHAKAVKGVNVLARIGSESALTLLDGVARRAKFAALQGEAYQKLHEVADRMQLSTAQLSDRLVPRLGLDPDGSMELDFGPRRFTVGFDEQLRPFVMHQDGTRLKALPKPGAKDDPELAPAAHATFGRLKKEVRTIAADQLRRLEWAMVTGRTWQLAEFRRHLVEHPLVWHLVRRLVWLADGSAFRLAEDRTFADVNDETLTPPEAAHIRLAHPVLLGDALTEWAETFADYEIIQPFPQLARPVFALAEEERSGRLARFEGRVVPVGALLGLERRGWERGMPEDGGVEPRIFRPFRGGSVVIDLDPGIYSGSVQALPDQRLVSITYDGELDPVSASEILADLTHLTEGAQ
ncbi:DUF4132 domain-containing protein [Actinomadura rudentiformis]|uniref:DUF4132 domain-containing protein n=1 Tax=Actinomadura rudentiformis TaxID=359158 RepID=A0A6H9Z396_9ACTN|nr:DUF4132 domain-containing protein [Actinomadura rudentiformis]KAB2350193.1 DUF4132 domain-containing protein [Actinomadura rudentiformis]